MDVVLAFIRAIPSAAASPLALIAYLATLAAWVIIAYRVNRFRELMKHIKLLPEKDRLPAIKAEMGTVDVPYGLTGEQYLRKRIHTFVFIGFLVLCATAATVGLKAGYDVYQQMIRADNLAHEILTPPTSDYMSAVNTLANGAGMVSEAAAEIQPTMSKTQLDQVVDRMVQQGLNGEQINDRLAGLAGTGRLRSVNAALTGAAARLNDSYGKLAECFRQAQCRPGFDNDRLCQALAGLERSIDLINDSARKIPSVNYNASATVPMLGGGSMDVDFSKISAPNIDYLISASCAA